MNTRRRYNDLLAQANDPIYELIDKEGQPSAVNSKQLWASRGTHSRLTIGSSKSSKNLLGGSNKNVFHSSRNPQSFRGGGRRLRNNDNSEVAAYAHCSLAPLPPPPPLPCRHVPAPVPPRPQALATPRMNLCPSFPPPHTSICDLCVCEQAVLDRLGEVMSVLIDMRGRIENLEAGSGPASATGQEQGRG